MGKNKHKINTHFSRHEIKYPEDNPIKDLVKLYEQDEIDNNNEEDDSQGYHETISDKSLKSIIENNRKKHKKRLFIWILLILFALASSALAGFIYFSNNKNFEQQNLSLSISGPEKIRIGEEFELTIHYQNLGQIDLLNSKMYLQYPHGFIVEKQSPEPVNHNWPLGNLAVGDGGEIIVSGMIIDELEQDQKITANLIFEPSNFNSQFSKDASFSLLTEEPDLEIKATIPSNITLGQKINIKFKLENKTDLVFNNVKIKVQYPENFIFQSAQPSSFEDDNQWLIAELEKSTDSKEFIIEGYFPTELKFNNEDERQQKFIFDLYLPGNDDIDYKVQTEEINTKIIDQAINTYTIINGTTENKNVELGQTLEFSLVCKNNGDQNYENVILLANINTEPTDVLNWNKIDDEYFGKINKTDQGKSITWDKSQISELANFAPGQELKIDFSIPLYNFNDLTNVTSLGNVKITASSALDISSHLGTKTEPVKSSDVLITINSDLDLGNKLLYYYEDGTPIGSGALPFQVNEPTTVKVFWDLSNDIHEMENINVSATLPDYVEWINEKYISTGDLSYDPITSKITWLINRLPESVKEAHANFSIKVTPKATQAGQIIKLLGNTTLSSKDTITQATVIKTKNILTSALEFDQYAETDGIVLKK